MRTFFILVTLLMVQMVAGAQPAIGSSAPDISLPNAQGEVISLSSLKGKVVVLDFWASWCGPCRISNRTLVKLYREYKHKGLEVFGVSLDVNKRAWTKAVEQDQISWLQVIDTRAANGNELTQTWNLRYIPSTFLINKEGKIVASGLEPAELEKWVKKML